MRVRVQDDRLISTFIPRELNSADVGTRESKDVTTFNKHLYRMGVWRGDEVIDYLGGV